MLLSTVIASSPLSNMFWPSKTFTCNPLLLDTCIFIGVDSNTYPSAGISSVIVYIPSIFLPSTYWYNPDKEIFPSLSVSALWLKSSPSIKNWTPDNFLSLLFFSTLISSKSYVGIFSSDTSTNNVTPSLLSSILPIFVCKSPFSSFVTHISKDSFK